MKQLKAAILKRIIKKGGCWEWTGMVGSNGYGMFQISAHRISYMVFVGAIPRGLEIDHKCNNKLCVNPKHLRPLTKRENTLRGNACTAINARKTQCIRGHKFTKENTYRPKKGSASTYGRYCRVCRCEDQRRRRERLGIGNTSKPYTPRMTKALRSVQ